MNEHPIHRLIAANDDERSRVYVPRGEDPKKIPLFLSGGMGDVIMSLPLVAYLSRSTSGEIEVYSHHPEAYAYFNNILYGGELPVGNGPFLPEYTWHMDINSVVRFHQGPGYQGISIPFALQLYYRQRTAFKHHPDLEKIVMLHPRFDHALAEFAAKGGLDRRSLPFFTIGLNEAAWVPLLRSPVERNDLPEWPYITIHDGYETASAIHVPGRATKTWKWDRWNSFVKAFKRRFPDHKVIQLGAKTARVIDGVDECWVNETTISQALEIIRLSSLHVDTDSGMAHAATFLGVPCVVMFGPTPMGFYGYQQNHNLKSEVCPSHCFWLKKDWMARCPIGFASPRCMDEITEERVLEACAQSLTTSADRVIAPSLRPSHSCI